MLERSPKSLLCGLLLAATACSLPSVFAEQQGPEIVLTAAEPVAEFDVTVCMNRPDKVDEVMPSVHLNADVEVTGERAGVLRGQVDLSTDEFRHDELDLAITQPDDGLRFDLEAEGPWGSGQHCLDPQRVRFEYEGDDPMAELRLTWDVYFNVDYSYDGLGRSGFEDDDLSIEIEPVQ